MSEDPLRLPIGELLKAYRRHELSPVEVTKEAFERIDRRDGILNAMVTTTEELALKQAAVAERRYFEHQDNDQLGRLCGVPISVKDAFDIEGVVTTYGSLIYKDNVAQETSPVVLRLFDAGAVCVGKTNMPEFAQSATSENRLGPPTVNPWDEGRTPGGSSSGAAASVAGGFASLGLGSDGGGSIRIPAAFCGLVGHKPSAGMCGESGGMRGLTEFVAPGPLAWRVDDARRMVEILTGRSLRYQGVLEGLRIAWSERPEGRPVDPGVGDVLRRAVDAAEEAGLRLEAADPPLAGWEEIFDPLLLEEEWRERGVFLGRCPELLTDYVRRELEVGSSVSQGRVADAKRGLRVFRKTVARFFDCWDVLLCPTVAVPAFPLGQRPSWIAGERVERLRGAFPFTAPFNVAGTPATSVPVGLAGNLPVGLQVVTRHGEDGLALGVAEVLEQALERDQVEGKPRRQAGAR